VLFFFRQGHLPRVTIWRLHIWLWTCDTPQTESTVCAELPPARYNKKRDKAIMRKGRVVTEYDDMNEADKMHYRRKEYQDWADYLRNLADYANYTKR
jgi:hypothetical protein